MAANGAARIIGVTGLPGAGKSAAAKIIAAGGGKIIDADQWGHAALNEPRHRDRLREIFGGEIFTGAEINRQKLGAIVFADRQKLRALEKVVHPWIKQKIVGALADFRDAPLIVIDAPLLKNLRLDDRYEKIFLLVSPFAARLARVQPRGWTAEELQRRDAAAQIYAPTEPRVTAIENSRDLNALAQTIAAALAS